MFDHPRRILVTETEHLSGLGAVRSLGRASHHIVAGYTETLARPASTYSKHCQGWVTHPDPWSDHARFREWWVRQLQSGDFDTILPTTEASVVAADALRDLVPSNVIVLVSNSEGLRYALSKYETAELAQSIGVPTPPTLYLGKKGEPLRDDDLATLQFPIVIKVDNHFLESGAYAKGQVLRVDTLGDAQRVLDRMRFVPSSVIAQSWVPGHGVGAFFLRFGGVFQLRFCHRRLHEVPTTGGCSSLRENLDDETILEAGERLLEATDFEGLAMVEFRRENGQAQPYLMEINGRLWGSIALALHAKVDFPLGWLNCHVYGAPCVEQKKHRNALQCLNAYPGEYKYVKSILSQASGPNWLQKCRAWTRYIFTVFHPRVKHDHFWWTDPAPGLIQAARMFRRKAAS